MQPTAMLIRAEQMSAFEAAGLRQFVSEMVAHSREFAPRVCERLDDQALRTALRSLMERAGRHQFARRGPVRLYIELALMGGSSFDSDPLFQNFADILGSTGSEMERARRLHQESKRFPFGEDRRAAFTLAAEPARLSPAAWQDSVVRELVRLCPRTAAAAGEAALRRLIGEAVAEARRQGFSTIPQVTLMVALLFVFGHRCVDDPLHPWIGDTLRDPALPEPAARSARLEAMVLEGVPA